MPAGRPSKYDQAMCERVVYGLHDGFGAVFYVGKTTSFRKRLAAYRSGRFHDNYGLKASVERYGLHWVILVENPEDLNSAEFDEIENRKGLVNLITDRNQPLVYAASSKPWVVPGVKCPSAQYLMFMRNSFGLNMMDIKKALKAMTTHKRMDAERRFAGFMGARASIVKWEVGCASS